MVGALCLIYIASLTFLLCQLDSRVGISVFFIDTESCDPVVVSYCYWFIQVCVFFTSLAEWSLGFTYVCVAAVDVTRGVVDGSTLVFFRCFVFRVYYHRAEGVRRFMVHVYVV